MGNCLHWQPATAVITVQLFWFIYLVNKLSLSSKFKWLTYVGTAHKPWKFSKNRSGDTPLQCGAFIFRWGEICRWWLDPSCQIWRRHNVSPWWGEKPQNRLLSKLNIGVCAARVLPVAHTSHRRKCCNDWQVRVTGRVLWRTGTYNCQPVTEAAISGPDWSKFKILGVINFILFTAKASNRRDMHLQQWVKKEPL